MYQISNFTENDDVNVLVEFGAFKVIEWKRDLSVTESSAITAYFASEMNVRRRQVICDLSQAPITVQAGAMQWSVGTVNANTGGKGAGDFAKGIVITTISSALYVAYATAARFFSVDSFQILLPQALFMLAATIVISLFVSARESTDGVFGRVEGVFGIKSWQNMLTGVLWSVANIAVLFSNQVNGVAVGWTLANMNLIFATLGGLFILHEKKTPKELRFVIAGMVLIALGGIAIGVTKLG